MFLFDLPLGHYCGARTASRSRVGHVQTAGQSRQPAALERMVNTSSPGPIAAAMAGQAAWPVAGNPLHGGKREAKGDRWTAATRAKAGGPRHPSALTTRLCTPCQIQTGFSETAGLTPSGDAAWQS
jgi:hypothetical protein